MPAVDPLAEREMLAQNGRVQELKKAASMASTGAGLEGVGPNLGSARINENDEER